MFTKQELKTLKDFLTVFEKHGASKVHSQLLNLDDLGILESLAGKPRSRHMRWTSDEDAIIMAKYADHGTDIPELMEHHTQNSIAIRARPLGIQRRHHIKWSEEDEILLRELYPQYGTKISALRAKFTEAAIVTKASRLGFSHRRSYSSYTHKEQSIIRQDYPKYGSDIPELRKCHTAISIRSKANQLGIHYDAGIFKLERMRNSEC